MIRPEIPEQKTKGGFIGKVFCDYFWFSDCYTYTTFKLIWEDEDKDEGKERVSLRICMN